MEVIPALDLRGGKCVRLYQGDYGRETVYSDDPVEVAKHWASLGAKRLHIVDLDGAKGGAPVNLEVVEKIASSVSVLIQLGGGIRTLEMAQTVMSMGVNRVIMGTAAVENPALIEDICDDLGADSLIVSVDARNGYVAVKGWTQDSRVCASVLIEQMAGLGVQRFMYTDITRDGTLTEPNFGAIAALVKETGVRLLAAGGIATVGHIVRLSELGVEGAIAGKALYTGDIDLRQALSSISIT
jgi:phosphoribosylformimino-5-aminoimidazole carboxamide ribotide isomerase